jgi:hypothetical protein
MDKIPSQHKFCIIIGGGMGGINVAAFILRDRILGYDEFQILDKNSDYGGVWQANQYPGAACDVVSHCYAMRWHLNPSIPNLRTRKLMPRMESQVCPTRGNSAILCRYRRLLQVETIYDLSHQSHLGHVGRNCITLEVVD